MGIEHILGRKNVRRALAMKGHWLVKYDAKLLFALTLFIILLHSNIEDCILQLQHINQLGYSCVFILFNLQNKASLSPHPFFLFEAINSTYLQIEFSQKRVQYSVLMLHTYQLPGHNLLKISWTDGWNFLS